MYHACIYESYSRFSLHLETFFVTYHLFSPTLFGDQRLLQPAACGLRSPATGATGAAASGGVARAALRAARERLSVPLGTARVSRTCASGWFSAGLLALAATGEIVPHLDRIRPGRRLPQPHAMEMWDNRIIPPHPTTHRRSPLAPPQYVPMSHDHIDPWGAGQGWSPSRTPHPRPFCNPEHSRSRTRARLHPDNLSSALLIPPRVTFCRGCLSRAHLTLVLSEHGPSQRTHWAFGRACACAVRSSGFIYFFGAELGLRSASCPSRNARLLTYSSRKRTRLYIYTRAGLVQGDARTRPASKPIRP